MKSQLTKDNRPFYFGPHTLSGFAVYCAFMVLLTVLGLAYFAGMTLSVHWAVVAGILGCLLYLPFLFLCRKIAKQVWIPLQRRLRGMRTHPFDAQLVNLVAVAETLCAIIDRYEDAYENEYTAQLLQKQAELDSLQSQINPHFLYNTLESIRGQAIEDGSPQTAEMIEVLSRLFQYTISQRGDLFALDRELSSVDHYLRIQQYRFNNRFQVIKTYDENNLKLLSHKIPKLSLQPIVENALYHGLESLTKPGIIEIGITSTQSRLIVYIADNGIGMTPETVHAMNEKLRTYTYKAETRAKGSKHSGIAMSNVNARLKLLYGQEYGVTVFSTLGMGTRVELTMPLLEV